MATLSCGQPYKRLINEKMTDKWVPLHYCANEKMLSSATRKLDVSPSLLATAGCSPTLSTLLRFEGVAVEGAETEVTEAVTGPVSGTVGRPRFARAGSNATPSEMSSWRFSMSFCPRGSVLPKKPPTEVRSY